MSLWDAMLKMTDIKLELMMDIDMFQFIDLGMRGGISYIANRYGKANNNLRAGLYRTKWYSTPKRPKTCG